VLCTTESGVGHWASVPGNCRRRDLGGSIAGLPNRWYSVNSGLDSGSGTLLGEKIKPPHCHFTSASRNTRALKEPGTAHGDVSCSLTHSNEDDVGEVTLQGSASAGTA